MEKTWNFDSINVTVQFDKNLLRYITFNLQRLSRTGTVLVCHLKLDIKQQRNLASKREKNIYYSKQKFPKNWISKPNKRSCRIFLEKLLGFYLPCISFFCVAKFVFSIFRKKCRIFYCWIHWKKIRKFFTVNFIEKKNLTFFRKIGKKIFLPQKIRVTGRLKIPTIFPGKSDMIFRWVLIYISRSRVYRQRFMYKKFSFRVSHFFSDFEFLVSQIFVLKQFFDHFCQNVLFE